MEAIDRAFRGYRVRFVATVDAASGCPRPRCIDDLRWKGRIDEPFSNVGVAGPRVGATLILLLVGAILTACGGAASPPATSQSNTTAQPAATEAAEGTAPAEATTAPAAAGSGKKAITLYTTSDTNITDWLQNTIIPAFLAKYPQYDMQLVDAGDPGVDPIVKRALAGLQTGGDPQVELMEGDPRDFKVPWMPACGTRPPWPISRIWPT